jgi:hypothetical protein
MRTGTRNEQHNENENESNDNEKKEMTGPRTVQRTVCNASQRIEIQNATEKMIARAEGEREAV